METETFNLVKLYDHFVEKKLQVYFKEKCQMELSNPRIRKDVERKRKEILDNFENLAVQQILKIDLKKHLPTFKVKKLNADEMEVLVHIGLVYEVNNVMKFAHQTYGEFGFNRFLDHHFVDADCAKFIVQVVLVDESYQIIRSFLNFWILEKVNQKTCELYREELLGSSVEGEETPLHVAGGENNENIFRFLYSALAAKGENFENKKTKIENYLLKLPKKERASRIFPFTAFAEYFLNCNDDFNLLSQIQTDFETEFLKTIFTFKMDEDERLLHAICLGGCNNALKVLSFLRIFFSKDLNFLKNVLSLTDEDGLSFLHNAFWFLKNETLVELLEELGLLKSLIGQDFFNELILMRSRWGVFLSRYTDSFHFSNNYFIRFLNQLKKLCGEEILKNYFLTVDDFSRNLLHEFCENAKNFDLFEAICWVNRELGKEFLIELMSLKEHWNKTIFHKFTESSKQSNTGTQMLTILKFLKLDLKLDNATLLDQILFDVDENGSSVFSNLFTKPQEKDFYSNFFDFLETILKLPEEGLENYLIKAKFLLFRIAQIEKSNRDEIPNMLFIYLFNQNNTPHIRQQGLVNRGS
jgi:hypothetical protein